MSAQSSWTKIGVTILCLLQCQVGHAQGSIKTGSSEV